ncbi:hypothetical protein DL765_005415 [Monosporascus sp. GIB2]|nr:hypothetical protein DL765_005415 [Monosporascus sp. GIB2]
MFRMYGASCNNPGQIPDSSRDRVDGIHINPIRHQYRSDDEKGVSSVDGDTWAVSSGVILDDADQDLDGHAVGSASGDDDDAVYARHVNTAGTKDGGLSPYIVEVDGRKLEVHGHWGTPPPFPEGHSASLKIPLPDNGEDVLNASCHLPSEQEKTIELLKNPEDVKWWLRPPLTPATADSNSDTNAVRYLAASSEPGSSVAAEDSVVQLGFATLPSGILKSYESTPGVLREFCPRCGATVFWHARWRPDLIDVSVGLFDAPEGSRAEKWMDWWSERVSFIEEVTCGRRGESARRAKALVKALEKGLRTRVEGSTNPK